MRFGLWSTLKDNIDFHTDLSKLNEAISSSRYSVEVNFRSSRDEVMNAFAKIVLGYVSAALKQNGYHIKHVFEAPPIRILVSSRAFDDGEWVGIAAYNPQHDGGCFTISRGFYNRDRQTVGIQDIQKCNGSSAADITAHLRNLMHELKNTPDRHLDKLKPVPLKRGPKR